MTRVGMVVLGAGPAGIAAALAAGRAGVPVLVIDAAERPGGQLHRREPSAFRAAEPGALHHGWGAWQADLDALAAIPHVSVLARTAVWSARHDDGITTLATDSTHLPRIEAEVVVLATGAHEHVLPFPGWDLPGVLTLGGVQALLKGQGVRPGERVVVAGTGPLVLPVAAALATSGVSLPAVADASSPTRWLAAGPRGVPLAKVREAAAHLTVLARHRVRLAPRTAVVAARGDGRVEEVTLTRVDARGRALPGTARDVAADALAVSHGFAPNVDVAVALGCALEGTALPRVRVDVGQRTSVRGVLAVGEVTGIGGGDVGRAEGEVAGLVGAELLGAAIDRRRLDAARTRRRRQEPFVRALAAVLAPPTGALERITGDTLVCRCEEVPRAAIDAAIETRGAGDLRSIKLTTRCGMGMCQGRMCAPNVALLLEAATGAPPADVGALARRPVLEPVPLSRLVR